MSLHLKEIYPGQWWARFRHSAHSGFLRVVREGDPGIRGGRRAARWSPGVMRREGRAGQGPSTTSFVPTRISGMMEDELVLKVRMKACMMEMVTKIPPATYSDSINRAWGGNLSMGKKRPFEQNRDCTKTFFELYLGFKWLEVVKMSKRSLKSNGGHDTYGSSETPIGLSWPGSNKM